MRNLPPRRISRGNKGFVGIVFTSSLEFIHLPPFLLQDPDELKEIGQFPSVLYLPNNPVPLDHSPPHLTHPSWAPSSPLSSQSRFSFRHPMLLACSKPHHIQITFFTTASPRSHALTTRPFSNNSGRCEGLRICEFRGGEDGEEARLLGVGGKKAESLVFGWMFRRGCLSEIDMPVGDSGLMVDCKSSRVQVPPRRFPSAPCQWRQSFERKCEERLGLGYQILPPFKGGSYSRKIIKYFIVSTKTHPYDTGTPVKI